LGDCGYGKISGQKPSSQNVMFEVSIEPLNQGHVEKYRIMQNDNVLSYADVLDLWQNHHVFRDYFSSLLADTAFAAYRWETPPITKATKHQPFEYVLINYPAFNVRPIDKQSYQKYFTNSKERQGIVVFKNLGGDATLIVPCPRSADRAYGHLAAFVRHAPTAQINALWQLVANTVLEQMSDLPIWVSTAGGGIAWLHVRLDTRPKYYNYPLYRNFTPNLPI